MRQQQKGGPSTRRTSKRLPRIKSRLPPVAGSSGSQAAANGTKTHKYKVVRVIKKRRKKLPHSGLPSASAAPAALVPPAKPAGHAPAPQTSVVQPAGPPANTAVAASSASPVAAATTEAPPAVAPVVATSAAAGASGPPVPQAPTASAPAAAATAAVPPQAPTSHRHQPQAANHSVVSVTAASQPTTQPPASGRPVVNRADSSGLISATHNRTEAKRKPPALSKEVIEWLAHDRLARTNRNLNLRTEAQSRRSDLLLERQAAASKQMRLVDRLGADRMRDNFNAELAGRLFEAQLRRTNELPTPPVDGVEMQRRLGQLGWRLNRPNWPI